MTAPRPGPLGDSIVEATIERIRAESRPSHQAVVRLTTTRDPEAFADYALPISAEQGDLIYLLCRATGATRVAECATSHGISTLYLAAAVRDNGGGRVIGSEIVEEKARRAERNLIAAALRDVVEIRVGDALRTFTDLGGPIDFLLIDGWPGREPSLARSLIELVAPQLRDGAIVVNDNGERDYLDYVRDPGNGFLTMDLPLKGGTELSVRTGSGDSGEGAVVATVPMPDRDQYAR